MFNVVGDIEESASESRSEFETALVFTTEECGARGSRLLHVSSIINLNCLL